MDTSIGERIKELRKAKHLTQTQIHELTGISSGNLSGIESGKSLPSASAVVELAKVLQCSTDYILTGKTNSDSPTSENFDIDFLVTIEETELLIEMRKLPPDDREELLALLHMKYQKILNRMKK